MVITGHSGSEATAKFLASEGAHVYITGGRQQSLNEAIKRISQGAVGVKGDIANGVPLYAIDESHFDLSFDVNVKGVILRYKKHYR